MRCKTCDYPLWNLPARSCPECGTAFLPSQYEFVINSVRFCCPSCGQDYYGTGDKGHLVPDAFACVRCGRALRMDDMVLSPTAGVDERRTEVAVVPWLDKTRRAFFGRWLATIGMAIAMPGRLARAIPGDSDAGTALWFALLTGTVYLAIGGAILLIPAFVIGFGAGGGPLVAIGWLIGYLIGIPVGLAICLALWSLLSHGLLRLTGPTAFGLGRTMECICYAIASNLLMAVPCLGLHLSMIAWIWWGITAAMMIRATQRVSGFRAAVAALTPPLLVVLGVIGWVAIIVVPSTRTALASAHNSVMMAAGPAAATKVVAGLKAFAAANNGEPPAHGLALLADKHVFLSDLYLSGFPSSAESSVAGVQVMGSMYLTPSERNAAIAAAAKTLPTGVIAHRMGDMVFVYHGIDLSPNSQADPGLWVVVCGRAQATPPAAGSPGAVASVVVGTLGNGARPVPIGQWPTVLAQQNVLRAAAGLPPLPDVLAVTQDQPASAAPGGSPP